MSNLVSHRKIRRVARQENVPPLLFDALVNQESGRQKHVVSPAGARGPTQLMPGTARGLGVNPDNPTQNLHGGARYLHGLLGEFGGNRKLALAAYNAGPNAVKQYGGVPPYAETQAYVRNILSAAGHASRNSGSGRGAGATFRRGGVPMPGPVGRPAKFSAGLKTNFNQQGFEQAQRRTLLSQILPESRFGVLYRTGVLSTAAPNPADFSSTQLVSSMTPGKPINLAGRPDRPAPVGGIPSGQVGKAIRAARKRLGISEVGGTNRSPAVDRMERHFGFLGAAWCGIFAGTVLRHAGVQGVSSRIASTALIEQDAKGAAGPFSGFSRGTDKARPGDLLLVRQGGPDGHVEVITRVDRNGTVHTIGGNVGNAVRRNRYPRGGAYGVAHVRYQHR